MKFSRTGLALGEVVGNVHASYRCVEIVGDLQFGFGGGLGSANYCAVARLRLRLIPQEGNLDRLQNYKISNRVRGRAFTY